jgi:hypothetical protein
MSDIADIKADVDAHLCSRATLLFKHIVRGNCA